MSTETSSGTVNESNLERNDPIGIRQGLRITASLKELFFFLFLNSNIPLLI